MSDLISRQAAIMHFVKAANKYECGMFDLKEVTHELWEVPSADTDLSDYSDRLWKNAYERGKAEGARIPSAEPERKKGQWIPCGERLPERNVDVLVSDGEWKVVIARVENLWDGEREEPVWWMSGYGEIDAWAWMPLPEAWKGEEDEAD